METVQERLSPQTGDGGSNPTPPHQAQIRPKELYFREIDNRTGDRYLVTYHYLHRKNTYGRIHFGAFHKGRLVGVTEFSYPVLGVIEKLKLQNGEVSWNSRTHLSDECGKNSESRFLGWCLRVLPKLWESRFHHQLKAVVAYADRKQGHTGTIYRALGMKVMGFHESMTGKNVVYKNSKSMKVSYIKWIRP